MGSSHGRPTKPEPQWVNGNRTNPHNGRTGSNGFTSVTPFGPTTPPRDPSLNFIPISHQGWTGLHAWPHTPSLPARDPRETPLRRACLDGALGQIATLMRNGDVNAGDTFQRTALHGAAQHARPGVVQILLGHPNINVNARDADRQTPLGVACRAGGGADIQAVVALLLARPEIDPSQGDVRDDSPLHAAAERNSGGVVVLLVQHPSVDVNAANSYQETPLWTACLKGCAAVVQILLGCVGVDVNQPDRRGLTPLHMATRERHVEVACMLLGRVDINVNARDNFNSSILRYAGLHKTIPVLRVLLQRSDVDLNDVGSLGYTPLHGAVVTGSLEIVKMHLAVPGTHINLPDACGRTPFLHAFMAGRMAILRSFFYRADLNLNLRDQLQGNLPAQALMRRNALQWASNREECVVIRLLITHGLTYMTTQQLKRFLNPNSLESKARRAGRAVARGRRQSRGIWIRRKDRRPRY